MSADRPELRCQVCGEARLRPLWRCTRLADQQGAIACTEHIDDALNGLRQQGRSDTFSILAVEDRGSNE